MGTSRADTESLLKTSGNLGWTGDRDGTKEETVTACQAACPTGAFSFGDLNDKSSAVVARKASPLDYAMLAEQQTHPRVTYEARIRNPSPLLEG